MDNRSGLESGTIAPFSDGVQLSQHGLLSSAEVEQIAETSINSFSHSAVAEQKGSNLNAEINNEFTIGSSEISSGYIEFEPDLSEHRRSIADAPSLASIAPGRNSEEFLTDTADRVVVCDRPIEVRVLCSRRRLQRERAKRVENAKALSLRDQKKFDHDHLLLLEQRVCNQKAFIFELERRLAGSTEGVVIPVAPDRIIIPLSHLPMPPTLPTLHPVVVVATLSSRGSMRTCITESVSYNQSQRDLLFQQKIAPTSTRPSISLSPLGFNLDPLQIPTNGRNDRHISTMLKPVVALYRKYEKPHGSYFQEKKWEEGEAQDYGNAVDEVSLSEYIDYVDIAHDLQERSMEHSIRDYYQHAVDSSSISNTVPDRGSIEEVSFSNLDALEGYRPDVDVASPTPDERHMQIWNKFFSNAMKNELPLEEGAESTRPQNHFNRGDRMNSASNLRNSDSLQTDWSYSRSDGDVLGSSAEWQDRMQQNDFADYPSSSSFLSQSQKGGGGGGEEEEGGAVGGALNFSHGDEKMFGAASSAEGRSDSLLSAVLRCDLVDVEELLSLGADPNHHTAGKLESLPYAHIAAHYGFDYCNPSQYGAEGDSDEEEKRRGVQCLALLAEYGADLDAVDGRGQSALHVAAEIGNYAALEYLLESAVNAKVGDSEGDSALHLAMKGGHIRCCDILLSYVTSPFPSPAPIPSPSPCSLSATANMIDKTSYKLSNETAEDEVIKTPEPIMLGVESPSSDIAATNGSRASAASVTSPHSTYRSMSRSDVLTSRERSDGGRKLDATVQELPSNAMRQMLYSTKGSARDRLDVAISTAHRRRLIPSAEPCSRRSAMSSEQDTNRWKHNNTKSLSGGASLRTSASHHRHRYSSDSDGSGPAVQRYKRRESRLTPGPPSVTSCFKLDRAIDHSDRGRSPTPPKRSKNSKEYTWTSSRSPEIISIQDAEEHARNTWRGDGDGGNSKRYHGSSRESVPSTPHPNHPQYFSETKSDGRHSVQSAVGDVTAQRPILAGKQGSSTSKIEDKGEEEVEDGDADGGGSPVNSDRVSEAVWYVASSLITFAHSMLFTTGPVTDTVDQYEGLDDRQYSDRRISKERSGWWGGKTAASLSADRHSAAYQQTSLSISWEEQEGKAEREMSGPPTDAHLKNRGLGFDYNVTSTPPPLVAQDILVAKTRTGVVMGETLRTPSEVSVAIAVAAGRNLSVGASTRHDRSRAASSSMRKHRTETFPDAVSDVDITLDKDGDVFPELMLHDAVSPGRDCRPPLSPLPTNGYSIGAMPTGISWRYVDVLKSRNSALDRKGS